MEKTKKDSTAARAAPFQLLGGLVRTHMHGSFLLLLTLSAALASSAEAPVPDVHIHTPLLRSSKLSERVGGSVYLKMDALQPGGSFKARGIGRLCTHLVRERGVTRLV